MNADNVKSTSWKRFFKIKKLEKLPCTKETFILTFSDTDLFSEFREFVDDDEATNYLKFCENYTRLEQLVSKDSEKSTGPNETVQSMARFMAADNSQHVTKALELPVWLVPHFLIFYATFLSSGCPCPVLISQESRLSILSQLEAGSLHKIKSNIFDNAADEVLNSLYRYWYPRFLANRYGDEMPELDPNLIPIQSNQCIEISRISSSSTDSRMKSKKTRKRSVLSFKTSSDAEYRNPIDLVFTKDCFARILYDQFLCKEFADFIEADHCKENMMFFDSYSKLERLLIENVPKYENTRTQVPVSKLNPNSAQYGKFVSCFLQLEDVSAHPNTISADSIFIPSAIYSHFILFHATYIAPGSPHEVNITDKLRKKIAVSLALEGGRNVPSSVFEGAVKEVMDLMYLNTFKKFVAARVLPKKD